MNNIGQLSINLVDTAKKLVGSCKHMLIEATLTDVIAIRKSSPDDDLYGINRRSLQAGNDLNLVLR